MGAMMSFLQGESGQGLAEYSFIFAIVVLLALGALVTVGNSIETLLGWVGAEYP